MARPDGAEGAAPRPAAPVEVQVRYLSVARDRAGGRREETVTLPAGSRLADLARWLEAERGLAPGTERGLMATLNGRGWGQLPAGAQTPLADGDRVALFPLVSGG